MPVDLSIIIVNYRCWEKLDACLRELESENAAIALEVIVVDNDSADGQLTSFANEHPSVQFVQNGGNWGFASGCNRGAEEASAPTLLFLNPDTLATPQALVDLLAAQQTNIRVGVLHCQ